MPQRKAKDKEPHEPRSEGKVQEVKHEPPKSFISSSEPSLHRKTSQDEVGLRGVPRESSDLSDVSSPAGKRRQSVNPMTRAQEMKPLALTTTEELDPKHNILTGWIKIRNAMKRWKNRWFVLRQGVLIYYKEEKSMHKDRCVGIVQLADCKVEARPTKVEGFSFRIYNTLNYPIYLKKGLKGESIKSASIPMGQSNAILLVGSEQERKTWIAAIQDQINFATNRRASTNGSLLGLARDSSSGSGFIATLPVPTPSASAFTAAIKASDHGEGSAKEGTADDDDDESAGGSILSQRRLVENITAKSEETMKALIAGLSQQQLRIQKAQIKAMLELDEKIQEMEKKIVNTVNRAVSQAPKDNFKLYVIYFLLFLILFVWWRK